ncbi:protein LLP homolog [Hetaerina americana]|uniref:protein LLP homolog n=1 Tax=Hetaerina americana TaxID=62018 RepID=UPI003A7F1FD4
MAKSIRSKWKKKMRAVKRVRYGKKELEKLKLIVGAGAKTDVEMENISEIATVTDAASLKEKKDSEEVENMEVGSSRKFNKKTFRDQNGSFPVWMSQRQIKKKAKAIKKKKKKTKNKK